MNEIALFSASLISVTSAGLRLKDLKIYVEKPYHQGLQRWLTKNPSLSSQLIHYIQIVQHFRNHLMVLSLQSSPVNAYGDTHTNLWRWRDIREPMLLSLYHRRHTGEHIAGHGHIFRICQWDLGSHRVSILFFPEVWMPDTHFSPSRMDVDDSLQELSSTTEGLMLSSHSGKE